MTKRAYSIILMFTLISSLYFSCNKTVRKNDLGLTNSKFDYRIEMVEYIIDSITKQVYEVYINKENDTTVNQKFTYKNGIIDTSKSHFYKLNLFRSNELNYLSGNITLIYDSIEEGKITDMNFTAISKVKDSIDFKSFDVINSNSLEFKFPHKSDTLIALLYLQLYKDTIINGENMLRNRQRYFLIDNYEMTNNPFVDIEL